MAQSFRTSRSSFTSNGYESPSLNPASVSNGDQYDSDGSNFAPHTPSTLSMAVPPELARQCKNKFNQLENVPKCGRNSHLRI
ncbi:hypothetical protein CsSME_00006114 [Camellia sinensis var. sinensis]